MAVMHYRIQMYQLVKESVSVHHTITWTVLKNLTSMFLSIDMMVHFVFNVWIE